MKTATVRIAGALVLPKMSNDMNEQALTNAFAAIGLKGPEARTRLAAIKCALLDVMGKSAGQNITALEDADGYTVAQTTASLKEGVTARAAVTAYLYTDPASPTGSRVKFDGPEELRAAFNAALAVAKGQVDRDAVQKKVVAALAALGATTITDNGGVYWLPDAGITRWETLAQGLEAASASRTARCYMIRTVGDADSIRTIADAFAAQVDAEIREVEADLAKDDVTDRVRDARVSRIAALQSRIALYEKELGTSLAALRERAAKATKRETAATLLDMNF